MLESLFNIVIAPQAILLKRDCNKGVFLQNLQKVLRTPFYRAPMVVAPYELKAHLFENLLDILKLTQRKRK